MNKVIISNDYFAPSEDGSTVYITIKGREETLLETIKAALRMRPDVIEIRLDTVRKENENGI